MIHINKEGKVKNIILFFVLILFFGSCAKDKSVILDLKIKPEEITRIELRADHKTLVPNGISQMEFHPFVYAKRKIQSHNRDADGKFYTKEIEQEILVPRDQVPEGYVKIYDQAGTELKNRIYSTTTATPGTVLQFYAKGVALESPRLNITIRSIPDESYDEIVVPVIFHLLLPPPTAGPTYDISTEFLEQQLKRVSDIFNRKITTDPNAGNVKITFKLATYDKSGVSLQEPGRNVENITAADLTAMGTSSDKTTGYKAYILKQKTKIIWDPNKYLNIWLTKFTTSTSSLGSASYKFLAPTVMHPDYPLSSVPGLTGVVHKSEFSLNDVTDCLQAGIMINYMSFFNPTVQGSNEFCLATVIAGYYGILLTQCDKYNKLNPDGDSDYCPDTYSFDYGYYPSVYKGNNLDGQPENDPTRPMEYFTSFNIMDIYSRKNSVSIDQTVRMRKVLEQCPSRWSYKSNWAFTGK